MNNNQKKDLNYFRHFKENDLSYPEQITKYRQVIPGRDFIAEFLACFPRADLNRLAHGFGFNAPWQFDALQKRLDAMVREARIFKNQHNEYSLVDKNTLIQGRLEGRSEGHGYLYPDNGSEPIFITPQNMRDYLHSDIVEVKISGLDHKGQRIGVITRLITRSLTEFIGRVIVQGNTHFIQPENRKLAIQFLVEPAYLKGAQNLQIVRAKMRTPPTAIALPTAEVLNVLGDEITANIAIEQAILEYNLPAIFSQSVMEEIQPLADEVSAQDKKGRKDYRALPLVTIDGITARDFDDAVYCTPFDQNCFKLYVAIADVAHYVQMNSRLNEEALARGTSVYFPDRVIPMLPEKLSNGLCSLNPDTDRLCMVCELVINQNGEMLQWAFFEGVMRSHARLTYETVAEIIKGDERVRETYRDLVPHLDQLYALFKVLRMAREKRGTINFETHETVIEYDEKGNIEKIIPSERTEAHMIIEECMICANIAAATFLESEALPTLYRVHPKPMEERLRKLRIFLQEFNLGIRGDMQPTPKDYADCLQDAKKNPAFDMIQTVMLRSLSQALYQPQNEGHFGLALSHYAHFTSPIRRYPDLLVHRGIKYLLHAKTQKDHTAFAYTHDQMISLGEQTSYAERRADEAVRDVTDWLKCQYMEQYIGQIFKGYISSVTNFGLFVTLEDIFIEGLVHISSLKGDYYHYDEAHHRLIGERTGHLLRLNDPLSIRVVDANIDSRFIDFEIIALGKKNMLSRRELAKVINRPRNGTKKGQENGNKINRERNKLTKKDKHKPKIRKKKSTKR